MAESGKNKLTEENAALKKDLQEAKEANKTFQKRIQKLEQQL